MRPGRRSIKPDRGATTAAPPAPQVSGALRRKFRARRVKAVDGGPAIGALTDVASDALLTSDADQHRREAKVAVAAD